MIGMIGLGRTGLPIATNLIAKGREVIGYRRSDASALASAGGRVAKSPREVAENADVILAVLPNPSALEDVMSGENGLLAALGPKHTVVELSSYPLAVKERYRALCAEKGARFIDGEISGTPAMTAARTAVIMLAGEREECDAVIPICKDATDHAVYAGPFGAATKLKLIANVLVAVHTVAAAEAVLLAERSGLDVPFAIETLGLGAGSSAMFKFRASNMNARKFVDPAPGPVSMLAAYLDPIAALAATSDTTLPLFAHASDLFKQAVADGRGHHDIACVIELIDSRQKGKTS